MPDFKLYGGRPCRQWGLGRGFQARIGGWRRRADSNRRIEVLQTSALDHLATSPRSLLAGLTWCRGRDLNPHRLTPTTPSRWRVYQFHHLGRQLYFTTGLYHSPAPTPQPHPNPLSLLGGEDMSLPLCRGKARAYPERSRRNGVNRHVNSQVGEALGR